MSITIQCPECGKRYTVADSAAGKVATCRGCGVKMRIPAATPQAEPPPEPAPSPPSGAEAGAGPAPADLPTEMRANRSIAGRTCPICGRTIALGEPVRNCELCGETHHSACWQRHNGCGTADCGNAPLPQLSRAADARPQQAHAPPAGETKRCRFCGEDIPAAAVKCRFCGESLDESRARPRFQRKSDTARNALICGILSIFCCGIILGPIAIVLALNARKEIAKGRGALSGDGMATAGLVCGIVGTLGAIAIIVLRVIASSSNF